jgi:hypothetical protein
LSLGNCHRKPFAHTGQAGEAAHEIPQLLPGGAGGSPGGCRGELNG